MSFSHKEAEACLCENDIDFFLACSMEFLLIRLYFCMGSSTSVIMRLRCTYILLLQLLSTVNISDFDQMLLQVTLYLSEVVSFCGIHLHLPYYLYCLPV